MTTNYSNKVYIGRTDEKVFAIGLGTWNIRDYSRARKVFLYAFQHGVDNVDTAEMYDNGYAEVFVGNVVREYGRENIFITTKMLPNHLISSDNVLKAGLRAIRRMNIEYVDLFLIHWPNTSLPIREQIRNFEILVEKGISRYIGVSNFNRIELEEAINSTKKTDIVVNQVHYSVLNKNIEKDLYPFMLEKKVTLQAYSPIEQGKVKYHRILREIADKIGKTPIQIALNYVISHPNTIAVVKTENIDHLIEILGSTGWRLPVEYLEILSRI
ncbi:MAG: aldo/keto reductase [Desulfurococcaceae archaeon]